MSGNALTVVMLKCAGRLLAISAFAILVASNANAADLRLPIKAASRHEQQPADLEARKQLFEQFLQWLREHEQH
jgi:hypothetical protein